MLASLYFEFTGGEVTLWRIPHAQQNMYISEDMPGFKAMVAPHYVGGRKQTVF